MANGCTSRPEIELSFESEFGQIFSVPHSLVGHLFVCHNALPVGLLSQSHVCPLLDGVLLSGDLLRSNKVML